ncbi:DUF2513 domain-containing protein [Sphingomonas parapaucimobilis]|uniref:DUF2513 domain-containing protein n=1 Tax=Sphingomonas parapaucimobilis TaxID=28213 RepID=UPI0035C7931D
MKRDMDLIRDLLLQIENGKNVFHLIDFDTASELGVQISEKLDKDDVSKYEYHLDLLKNAKMIKLSISGDGYWFVETITWEGHDFLESIRDPKIWKSTKDSIYNAGGFTLDILKAVAKGIIRQKLERHIGVPLEL